MLPLDEESSLNEMVQGKGIDPYWAKLWESASDTAHCIFQTEWTANLKTLELGCGIGLAGIAGLIAGLDMTFSDHEPQAVDLALQNAALNGFENCGAIVLDWANPIDETFDVILASDVLYEQESHLKILLLAEQMLRPGGSLRIGDPGRQISRNFLNLANDHSWSVSIFDAQLKPCLAPFTNQFQWLVLQK